MATARFLIVRVTITWIAVTVRGSFGGYEPGAVAVRAGEFDPVVPFIPNRSASYTFAAVPNVAFAPNFAAEPAAAAIPVVLVRLYCTAATAMQALVPVMAAFFAEIAIAQSSNLFGKRLNALCRGINESHVKYERVEAEQDPP